ncbi:MAG: 2-hydroxyacid dehydrogenase [Janthinobacterium lividum]
MSGNGATHVARVLLVKSGGEAAVDEWRSHFAHFAATESPEAAGLDVRWWNDDGVAPEDVAYALVWQPDPGRLAALPNLRLILSTAAGADHITADPTWPRHVPLLRAVTPEAAQRMGEYVCMASLALLRDLKRSVRQQAERRWNGFETDRSATDTCVGILGLGTMGMRAAEMVRGLGFRTIGWSRSRKAIEGIECHAGDAELPGFLARCDILVCLLPATSETDAILSAGRLAMLPRDAALVHVGRGSHLRFDDLRTALDEGRLSGAFVDVFEEEPLPADHPAWTHAKIVVTPHNAAIASRRMRARFFAAQIAAFERGETPAGLYDAARGY